MQRSERRPNENRHFIKHRTEYKHGKKNVNTRACGQHVMYQQNKKSNTAAKHLPSKKLTFSKLKKTL